MARRLAAEIINVYNSTGKSIETMNNIKGIAEKNKAYAILKW
jgi:ribosomal protein S7